MFLEKVAYEKRKEFEELGEFPYSIEKIFVKRKRAVLPFKAALDKKGMSLIAEIKLASPSKGKLTGLSAEELAEAYSKSPADCISVLTDKKYFSGNIDNIEKVKMIHEIPVLMKDFLVSEYQVYQAALKGADCILLIAAILSPSELLCLYELCRKLGLDAIVEVHSSDELVKLAALGNDYILGVNSRDLKSLEVRSGVHHEIAAIVPEDRTLLAESGIKDKHYVKELIEAGYDAALIGESIVRSPDPAAFIKELKSADSI